MPLPSTVNIDNWNQEIVEVIVDCNAKDQAVRVGPP